MKDFVGFRNNVLTTEKLNDLIEQSKDAAEMTVNEKSWMASFSATFNCLMLAEYHDWIHQDE